MNRAPRLSPVSAAILLLTLIGFALRLSNFGQGLFGDEISTAWVVRGHSLGHILSTVKSDAEVTPPLSFVLSWASTKLGSDPALMRLPSLIAGCALIPLIYALGARTIGRATGVIAAALVTFSPYMIFYSTEARGYALMMTFVVASTLAMLAAVERSGWWRWALYGTFASLAMYCHYTAAFPLLGQLAWVLWAHPECRRQALLANVLAVVIYSPWLPGYVADLHSGTIPLINAVLPFTFTAVRAAIENWAIGYPYVNISVVPGSAWALTAAAGVAILLGAVLVRGWHAWRETAMPLTEALRTRVALVGVLALSAPVGEAIYSAIGSNVLGARNLNSSFPGLALAVGGLITAAPLPLAIAAGALVFAGIGAGTVKATQAQYARSDNPGVAAFIEDRWRPGDFVADGSILPVTPLTGLDIYLPQTHPELRFDLPPGPPPFLLASLAPPADELAKQLRDLKPGRRVFLVTTGLTGNGRALAAAIQAHNAGIRQAIEPELPRGYRVLERRSFPGVQPLAVTVLGPPQ